MKSAKTWCLAVALLAGTNLQAAAQVQDSEDQQKAAQNAVLSKLAANRGPTQDSTPAGGGGGGRKNKGER